MKKKLHEELIKMSTDIITSRELTDITALYEKAKDLYEKLAVLKFIEEKLHDVEIDVTKNVIAEKFEKLANEVMSENTSVPESNPHKEDIINHHGMGTIMDMVNEMPVQEEKPTDDALNEFLSKPEYMKNDKELFMPEKNNGHVKEAKKLSLNDKLQKEIKIGLNDKLAFVKHLFNGNVDEYNKTLKQLETIDTEERSNAFIVNMIKPDYNNWVGKEEYEKRFMAFIERKFA